MQHALLAALLATAVSADPTPRDLRGTELIVRADLDDRGAPPAEVRCQPVPALAAAFPAHLFALARFPDSQAADLPVPLAPRSLYAVGPDGTARLLATPDDVLDLLKSSLPPVKSAEDAAKAAEAALALEQAKYPEQAFAPPARGIQVKPDGKGGYQAAGTALPAAGPAGTPAGTGQIAVNVSIPPGGRPAKVVTNNNYQPPPPRRRGAVTPKDVAADEPAAQKEAGGPVTNINSPTINKFLPGSTVYAPQPAGEGEKARRESPVIVIGPDGKAESLSDRPSVGRFVRAQFGPVKTKAQAREVMEAFLALMQGRFPGTKFAPVEESDIKVEETPKGGLEVTGRVYVKGDRERYIEAVWTFTPEGRIRHATGGSPGVP